MKKTEDKVLIRYRKEKDFGDELLYEKALESWWYIMNEVERHKFWNTLCSLNGKNIEEDIRKLNETIILPKKLYRYRPVSIRSLEALKNNKLYFSTANYYDDPFDTFINVRIKDIRFFLSIMEKTDEKELINSVKFIAKEFGTEEVTDEIVMNAVKYLKEFMQVDSNVGVLESYFRNIRNEIKKEVLSVCFSESPLNETLWLKYAEQHKGFVVEYDLLDGTKLLCGKQEKCNRCGVNLYGSSLYPMYYTDEMYDATGFAQFLVAYKQFGNKITEKQFDSLKIIFGNQIWEKEKISLIKKRCHKFDEEWRMIIPYSMETPVMREWIPSAIYLGLNMQQSEMDLIANIAKQAGVDNIYKCIISDDGKLDAVIMR